MKKKIFLMVVVAAMGLSVASAKVSDNKKFDAVIEPVLESMTLREKIAQLIIIAINSQNSPERKEEQNLLVAQERIGGLIVMDDDVTLSMNRVNELQRMSRYPLIVTIDGEWGASMRYDEYPKYPYQMQLGALRSGDLIYDMGKCVGEEFKDLNIYVNFAPTIDINNNADNPVINVRSFGEDKGKVSRYGIEYMKGMQAAGIYTSAKHFPGHGDTNVDSHHSLPVLTFDKGRLESLELYPFREMIGADVDMVMVGHLSVPSLDPAGTPASISKPIVTGLLKEQMGYDGIVITDALGMKGVADLMEQKEVALAAYKAGVDILLMPEDVKNSIDVIENYIRSGEGLEAELDEKVRKMLVLKAKAGMFDKKYSPIVERGDIKRSLDNVQHLALIEQLSKNSLTLVRNEDEILPLKDLDRDKIAYLGYRRDENARAFADMLCRYAAVDTFSLPNNAKLSDMVKMRGKLKDYDVVIMGIHDVNPRTHERFDVDEECSAFLGEWAEKQDMVGVYFGTPYALNKLSCHKKFKAYIIGYENTEINNKSAAQLIFGGVEAKGVLPVSTNDYKVGYSAQTPKGKRLEIVSYSENDTLKIENGKLTGHFILAPDGSKVEFDTPIFVQDRMKLKARCRKIFNSIGMSNTTIDRKGYVETTLDDLAKLAATIMNEGWYGGDRCMSFLDYQVVLSNLISLYSGELRYIFETDKGELGILLEMSNKNARFVLDNN